MSYIVILIIKITCKEIPLIPKQNLNYFHHPDTPLQNLHQTQHPSRSLLHKNHCPLLQQQLKNEQLGSLYNNLLDSIFRMVTLQIEDHLLVGEELKYIDHHSEKIRKIKLCKMVSQVVIGSIEPICSLKGQELDSDLLDIKALFEEFQVKFYIHLPTDDRVSGGPNMATSHSRKLSSINLTLNPSTGSS
ncbi:hypothetical protein AGLY_011182 [Aphis glycines]|uniref:Uncharacterized protein n=1 Tax=Aphis glycines TaxID=307491 RepID=A0A6G0TCP4_APHGL|nr:hypothetical protein AGLY_011182 [Aphis glycines]